MRIADAVSPATFRDLLTMKPTLGMIGPILTADFRDYLHPEQWRPDLPQGLGGSPVNLLSRELLRRGHRLAIFTLSPDVADEVVLTGPSLKLCIGPYRPRHRARDFFAVERAYLTQAIAREQPDILHAHWTYEFALPAQASGLPHVLTAHDAPLSILRLAPTPYRLVRTLMAYRVLRVPSELYPSRPTWPSTSDASCSTGECRGSFPTGCRPLFSRQPSAASRQRQSPSPLFCLAGPV